MCICDFYHKLGDNNGNSSHHSISVGLEKLCVPLLLKQKSMAFRGHAASRDDSEYKTDMVKCACYSALYGGLSNQKV